VRGNETQPNKPPAAELAEELRLAVGEYWHWLIEQCYADVTVAPQPTSALLDRSAAERRRRRIKRRAVAGLARALPMRRGGAAGPDGRAA
jgi:hypothetical protein